MNKKDVYFSTTIIASLNRRSIQLLLLCVLFLGNATSVFAQLHNTTFTTLGSGTRDSTADQGAVYYLDGNSTNGRLNIAVNAAWNVGDNSHILVDGNANHSFMKGIIRAIGLVYVIRVSGGGRTDFSTFNGGLEAHDITYYFTGNGQIYNHLENTRNQFTGFVRFIIDMTGGDAYLQFESREYANVALDIRPTNSSTISFYPARSSTGFTSLTGFTTINLSGRLELPAGIQSIAYGKIYDPVYIGATNNLLPIIVTGGGSGNHSEEYFTIDVTGIAHNDAKIRVTDNTNTVQYNNLTLTSANTTIFANDGTTPLTFYDGKSVVPVLVRTITTSLSNTRNTINYLIRRAGFQEIRVDNLAMNTPVVIEELLVDENWSNTGVIALVSDLDELYDEAKKAEANDLTLPILAKAERTEINTGNYNVILDDAATAAFALNTGNQTITVKTTALVASTQFSSLQSSGTISFANNATLEAGYKDATGTYAYVELTGMDQQDLAITAMNAGVSSTLLRLSNFSGTYKGHVQLPSLTASITALATRDGFAPWTDMLPIGDLLFQREVSTSPSSVTGSNQQLMIQLIYKLLQKTEALSNALYNTNNPVPSITVNTTTTSPTNVPSVANQESMLQLLYRILGKTTSLREAIQEE